MGRMTVTLSEELVEEAREILGVRTKSEAIRLALEDTVRRRKLDRALANAGRIDLGLDQEGLRRLREDG